MLNHIMIEHGEDHFLLREWGYDYELIRVQAGGLAEIEIQG